MKIKLSQKKSITVILYMFVFICIFFPADIYNLKLILFLCLLTICFTLIFNSKKIQYPYIIIMGVAFPIAMIVLSSITSGLVIDAIKNSYVAFMILLIIPILKFDINYKRIFMYFLKIESYITVLIVLADLLGVFDVNGNNVIRNFFYTWDIGYMGKSIAYSAYYKVFLKTSPLIIFVVDDAWTTKKYSTLVVSLIALFVSGTRSNFFVISIYLLWRLEFKTLKKRTAQLFLALLVGIMILLSLPYISSYINEVMGASGSIASDAVRTGQLKGLLESLSEPSTLLLGDGFGSTFINYGRNSETVTAELAYFNLLRQIGILLFIPFMFFITSPLTLHIESNVKVVYIGYLAIAFTNPLLFSTTAYLAYIYLYSLVYARSLQGSFYSTSKNILKINKEESLRRYNEID